MNNLVSATHLERWADERNSQALLPALIRSLILGSVDRLSIQRIEMPTGDSVFRPGVDGLLQVRVGNSQVPTGQSVWEVGTNKNKKNKANEDYQTRVMKPGLVNPLETT